MSTQASPLNHLAIIPDGNTRWAKANHKQTFEGYQLGFQRGIELARHARTLGIHTLTFWGLSTENWLNRPKLELEFIVDSALRLSNEYFADAQRDNVRIIHLGRRDRLPKRLLQRLAYIEEATFTNDAHVMNLALDYGGRDELVRAAARVATSGETPTYEALEAALDTAGQPYPNPDFIVRTSGETRLSGFMPWQSAYSEFYFEPAFFPDFTVDKLETAVAEYQRRQRRFGGGH